MAFTSNARVWRVARCATKVECFATKAERFATKAEGRAECEACMHVCRKHTCNLFDVNASPAITRTAPALHCGVIFVADALNATHTEFVFLWIALVANGREQPIDATSVAKARPLPAKLGPFFH